MEAGLIEKAAGLWGKAGQQGQQSLARSALVESATQLNRALAQIAALPATPTLRREQIKLQAALITPLIHVRRYEAPETNAAAGRARLLIEQAQACCSRFSTTSGSRAFQFSVQRRRSARTCGAIRGACQEARGDGPAHGRASPPRNILANDEGHSFRNYARRILELDNSRDDDL
jgi:hypothetical protein